MRRDLPFRIAIPLAIAVVFGIWRLYATVWWLLAGVR